MIRWTSNDLPKVGSGCCRDPDVVRYVLSFRHGCGIRDFGSCIAYSVYW